jgi:hypothetical protein
MMKLPFDSSKEELTALLTVLFATVDVLHSGLDDPSMTRARRARKQATEVVKEIELLDPNR